MGKSINRLLYRNSTRLKTWDYGANGNYYITICTKNKKPYFGSVKDSKVNLSEIGAYAASCWKSIPLHHQFVKLDEFVFMPDHMHGILQIQQAKGIEIRPIQFGSHRNKLALALRGFKSAVTSFALKNDIEFVWQSRYYEHVIRDEIDLNRIRKYIHENPSKYHQNTTS